MKNIRLLLFLLLIFISGNEVYCQKIFRDGYIIKKGGAPIYGLVEYSSNQDIPSKCIFKSFDIARVIDYSPETLIAFGYKNGNRYETKELNNKQLFFEVLVTGKIVLYRRGSGYFIEKDKPGLVELKNGQIKYQTANGLTEFKDLPAFLTYLTEGKSGIISSKFNLKNDIIPLVTSYNKDSGKESYVFNRTISAKQISQKALETGVERNKFGLVGGINTYLLKLTPDATYKDFLPSPEKESAMILGVSFERLLSRKSDKYSLRIELLYNKQTFYSYSELTKSATISRYDAFFNFTGIKVPVLFQYSFTGKKIVPFVNAGFAYQLMNKKDYVQISEVENTTLHEVKTFEARDLVVRSGEVSSVAGIGLKTRIFNNLNLNIQGRVEYGPGIIERAEENTLNDKKTIQRKFFTDFSSDWNNVLIT
jgi:hypothetical protein